MSLAKNESIYYICYIIIKIHLNNISRVSFDNLRKRFIYNCSITLNTLRFQKRESKYNDYIVHLGTRNTMNLLVRSCTCGMQTDNIIIEFFDSYYYLQSKLRSQCCKVTVRATDNGKSLLTAMKSTIGNR